MVDSSDNIDTVGHQREKSTCRPLLHVYDTLILAMGPRNLVYLANVIFECYTRTY